MKSTILSGIFLGSLAMSVVHAEEIKIVSWNMAPGLFEAVEARADDVRTLDAALSPDVIVLIEVAGLNEVREIARQLAWPVWYAAVSDGMTLTNQTSTAIETAVISRIPIVSMVEHDTRLDQKTHPIITHAAREGDPSIPVTEVKLDSRGIDGVQPTAGDRSRHHARRLGEWFDHFPNPPQIQREWRVF